MLDRTTVLIMTSSFIIALLCVLPSTQNLFPFWLIGMGLHIADIMFHELGHTLFAWLFGQPAIPMIFTLFGADQAGGMTLWFERFWFVQLIAFAALGYACYWTRENFPDIFIPSVIFSLFIVVVALTEYHKLVISFMGHGGAIFAGGFFLFRAWIYLDARNEYERWLNALFGFFLTLYNISFSYGLAFNSNARGEYSDHVAFGITHNDFMVIATMIHGWSVRGVAIFTIAYAVAIILGSAVCAYYLSDDFEDGCSNCACQVTSGKA